MLHRLLDLLLTIFRFLSSPLLRQKPQPAVCVARHGAREDYACKSRGVNWQEQAERPWDPPLTEGGVMQGAALGSGVKDHLTRLGRRKITRIISSPLLRCLQTAAAAADKLGVSEICIEPALTEGMLEDWYRSWAVPGADSTWGGPAHSRVGTPHPPRESLHRAALQPADTLLMTPAEAAAALKAHGSVQGVSISRDYIPLSGFHLAKSYGEFETEQELGDRMEAVVNALAERYEKEDSGSILLCSHGGPCGHAYRRLLGARRLRGLNAGYTALYIFVRSTRGWLAPVAADQSHLDNLEGVSPNGFAPEPKSGPNDYAEQKD